MVRDKRRQGSAMPLLLMLILLIGLGGYNYHRNWKAEQNTGPRPFETYETEDLSQLRDAYEAEVSQYETRYSAQNQRRVRASGDDALMQERVGEFERIQRNTERLRDLGTQVAEREARLREIEKELDYRLALATGFTLHVKRLTSI
jgi:hypothetical protein